MSLLKEKMMKLDKSDKQWWRLNRELINKQAKVISVPPLKASDGTWHLESKSKAKLLATRFRKKLALHPEVDDQYVSRPEIY